MKRRPPFKLTEDDHADLAVKRDIVKKLTVMIGTAAAAAAAATAIEKCVRTRTDGAAEETVGRGRVGRPFVALMMMMMMIE